MNTRAYTEINDNVVYDNEVKISTYALRVLVFSARKKIRCLCEQVEQFLDGLTGSLNSELVLVDTYSGGVCGF